MPNPIFTDENLSLVGTAIKIGSFAHKIFSGKKDVQKLYECAIKDTAKKLEEKHTDIFGGNTQDQLLEAKKVIIESFEPYGHLEDFKEKLTEYIHFENLPDSFFEDLHGFLIESLGDYRQTRQILVEHFRTQQIDKTHENAELLPVINEKMDRLLSIQEKVEHFESNHYELRTPYFIERIVHPLASTENDSGKSMTLLQLVESGEHKNIVLLNYAANGKSEELSFLAHKLSLEESLFEPMLVNLGIIDFSSSSLEKYLDTKHKGWRNLRGNLVLILDALDEVGYDFLDNVRKQILTIVDDSKQSTIIVSCRTNVYQLYKFESGFLDGFKHYELPRFSNSDIWSYLLKRFESSYAEDFYTKSRNLGFEEDLSTPFYLVRLANYYEQKKKLPTTKKKMFEWLIDELKTVEKLKSSNVKHAIEENEELLDFNISMIACLLQISDRNYLKNNELSKVVADKEVIKLLKRCYLLDNGATDKWTFEHNNFKEYLSAKFLASKDIDFIKKIVSVPELDKIKPSWLNALGFLISYLFESNTLKQLIEFLTKHDSQSLIRIEKDKIELPIREKIFFEILDDSGKKGIYPRSPKFGTEDLGQFVSDSKKVCEYLVDNIDIKNGKLHIDLSCYLLKYNQHWVGEKDQISERIIKILYESGIDSEIKKNCIDALKWFDTYEEHLVEYMLHEMEMEGKMKRKALYHYLVHSEYVENHIEFIMGAFIQDEYYDSFKHTILKDISSEKSYLSILKTLGENQYGNHHSEEMLAQVLEVMFADSVYSDELVEVAYASFKANHHFNMTEELDKSFLKYIGVNDYKNSLFKKALNEYKANTSNDDLWMLPLLWETADVWILLDFIKNRELEDEKIQSLRNILNTSKDQDTFKLFYDELNKSNANKFLWPQNREDPYQVTLQKQLDFLFDKEKFVELTKNLLNDNNCWIRRDLYEIEDFDRDNPEHVAWRNILGYIFNEEALTFNQILEYLENEDEWNFLVAFCLHKLISNGRDILTDKENEYLVDWATQILDQESFEETFFQGDGDMWKYKPKGLLAAGILVHFQPTLTEKQNLKLLSVDSSYVMYVPERNTLNSGTNDIKDSKLLQFVITQVGEKSVEERIVNRLAGNNLYSEIRKNHLRFIRRKNKKEHKNLFLYRNGDRIYYEYLIWYLELEGEIDVAFKEIDNYENYEKRKVMDAIIKRNKLTLRDYIVDQIKLAKDKDEEREFIQRLLACEDKRGLALMRDWIIKNREFMNGSSYSNSIKIDAYEALRVLKDIYYDSIKNDYGSDHALNERRRCLEEIVGLGLKSEESFKEVQAFLKGMVGEFPQFKMLHSVIDEMEYDYYENQSDKIPLDQAISLLSSI